MLKKLALLFVSLLILSSCDKPTQVGADGYRFGTKQYEKTSVQVNVVTYNTIDELRNAAKKYKVPTESIAAFAVLTKTGDVCTIHMMDPSASYEPEFVGHEFLHCVYGQWHTNNETFS